MVSVWGALASAELEGAMSLALTAGVQPWDAHHFQVLIVHPYPIDMALLGAG